MNNGWKPFSISDNDKKDATPSAKVCVSQMLKCKSILRVPKTKLWCKYGEKYSIEIRMVHEIMAGNLSANQLAELEEMMEQQQLQIQCTKLKDVRDF